MDNGAEQSSGSSRAALKRKNKLKKKRPQQAPLVAPAPSKKQKKKQKKEQKASPPPSLPPPPRPAATSDDVLDVVDAHDVAPAAVARAAKSRTQEDCDARGRRVLRALLAPVGARAFYEDTFEKRGLLVKGRDASYLRGWCSSDQVFASLEQPALAGVDVDVTRYDSAAEVRRNLRTEGVVDETWARRQLEQGATIRLRQPQDRIPGVAALCRALEGEFGATVGANAYLTARDGAQGFAAHWDDVDVFILQLEGRKRWRVGAPASELYRLPRASSADFDEEAIHKLCPHLTEIVLAPGDVLYLPRGFVHCATTEGSQNSLHLTLSTHRANAWADLLDAALPQALAEAIQADPRLREALPRDCLHFMGVAHAADSSDDDEEADASDDDASVSEVAAVRYDPEVPRSRKLQKRRRDAFAQRCAGHCKDVLARLLANLDATCDARGSAFVAERMPPARLAKGDPGTITATTRVHCAERRDVRLVPGDEGVLLYHALDNATTFRGRPVACLEFEAEDAPALEALLASHAARPVLVRDLPHSSDEDKVAVAASLYAEGLLAVSVSGKEASSDDSD